MTTKQITLTLTINESQNVFDNEDIAAVVAKVVDSGMEEIGSTGNIVYDIILDSIVNLKSIEVQPSQPPQGLEAILAAGIASGSVKVGI